MKNGTITKGNHFLPTLYLKGFEDKDGKLWCYDKLEQEIYAGTAETLGKENKLYHPEPPVHPNKYENFLTQKIETPAVPILKRLRNKEFPTSAEERETLSRFFSLLFVRTPIVLDHLQKQFNNEFDLIAQRLAEQKYDEMHKQFFPTEEDYNKSVQALLDGKIKVVSTRDFVLYNMCMHLLVAPFIAKMRWVLIEDSSEGFITSDNRYAIYQPYYGCYGAFGIYGSRAFIPLSNCLLLMMVNDKKYTDGQIYEIHNSGVPEVEFNESNK